MELNIADLEVLAYSAWVYPLCTVERALTLVGDILFDKGDYVTHGDQGTIFPNSSLLTNPNA
jgi:hypothetical protein